MSVRQDSFREALTRENLAEQALYSGDPEPYKAMWSRSPDVSLFGAFGPCKTGWSELSRIFDWIATRFQGGSVSLEYELVYEGTDLAFTVGYERGELPAAGGASRTHTIRVTQIYRRENGRWRLIHRHGDFAPVDKSPPAPAVSSDS